MNTLSRRRFLTITAASTVVAAAGGIVLTVRQLTGQGKTLSFSAVTGLPRKPFVSYASYVIEGNVNASNGTGTITQYVYAGPPESITSIVLLTRVINVSGVQQQGSLWQINGVVQDQASLQKGESAAFAMQFDSATKVADSTFFGSPIQLHLQRFVTS